MRTRACETVRVGVAGVMLAAALWALPVLAEKPREMPLLTGELWQQMDEDDKIAFVWGISHVLEFERQINGGGDEGGRRTFVPVLIRGLEGKSLGQVVDAVDGYYRADAARLDDPVYAALVRTSVLDEK